MKFLLTVALLIMTVSVAGQSFNGGLFGGITAGQVDGDLYSGFRKLGFTSGAYVNREIGSNFFWQVEIKWVMRGVYQGPTDANPDFLFRSTYHYIEFPLSVNYIVKDKFQLEGGFSPEVLVKVKFWDQDGLLDPEQYPENRRFGLSVFGGFHYWYTETASVGIRYTYSAIPFRDPEEWNRPPYYRGYFHNVLALTLGYRFMHK